MHPESKKMAVFDHLTQEQNPISLKDLLAKLGETFAERSTRRWLTELVEAGLIEQIGNKKGTKYRALKNSDQYSGLLITVLARRVKKFLKKYSAPYTKEFPLLT